MQLLIVAALAAAGFWTVQHPDQASAMLVQQIQANKTAIQANVSKAVDQVKREAGQSIQSVKASPATPPQAAQEPQAEAVAAPPVATVTEAVVGRLRVAGAVPPPHPAAVQVCEYPIAPAEQVSRPRPRFTTGGDIDYFGR